jgi:hypothetical protein
MFKILAMICALVGGTLLSHVVFPPTGNTVFHVFGFGITWALCIGLVVSYSIYKGMK